MVFVFFLLTSFIVEGQYYVSGNNPAYVNWKQINTSNFQVIYPEEFSEKAQRVANILEQGYEYTTKTLNRMPEKVSLVLHNQTAVSNGMAVWAPKRMEWYTAPPRDSYSQDWFEQLAIHEYRHVVQVDKLNQGLTKVFALLFGQQATAAVLGIYVPLWFLEGDAVLTETLLSKSGRGRLPDFEKDIKAQVLEEEIYSYDKAVFGSFKDYVLNHYKLGYLLVSEGRKHYGADLWSNTLNEVAKSPLSLNPFSRSLKKQTGFHKVKFYENVLDSLKKSWELENHKQIVKGAELLTVPVKGDFINYIYPHAYRSNQLICIKKSFDETTEFVIVDRLNNNDEKICKTGIILDNHFSFSENIICWAELKYDKRWGMKSSTNIQFFDISSQKKKTIRTKDRYYTPHITPAGNKVAAVHTNKHGKNSIVIFKIPDKHKKYIEIIDSIKIEKQCLLLDPAWNDNATKIVFVKFQQERGKSINVFDVKSGKIQQIVEPSFHEISQPQFYKSYILYNADYSGVDNFYAIDTSSSKIFQLTFSQYGCKYSSLIKDSILFSEYTADGYMTAISKLEFDKEFFLEKNENVVLGIDSSLIHQELGVINIDESNFVHYDETKYSKLLNLFNFHSWAPLYISTDDYNAYPGVSLFSQNLLSTAITSLGYEWNTNESRGIYHAEFKYTGLYPEVGVDFEYTTRSALYDDTVAQFTEKIYWDESSVTFDLSVPLSWNSGDFIHGMYPSLSSSVFGRSNLSRNDLKFSLEKYQTVEYRLVSMNYKRTSKRDLYPEFGQITEFNFMHTPFGNYNLGSAYSLETRLMLPGVFKHNHFVVKAGFQRKFAQNDFGFADLINYPRGYTDVSESSFYFGYFNYTFPIAYPDLSVGGLSYIKRLKTNLFFDYGENLKGKPYSSCGVDLTADAHFFRFLAPVEIGLRNSYLPKTNELYLQFLFYVNFYDI